MGWRQFHAWLRVMKRQVEPPAPDPYSWKVEDPWFAETKAKIARGGG